MSMDHQRGDPGAALMNESELKEASSLYDGVYLHQVTSRRTRLSQAVSLCLDFYLRFMHILTDLRIIFEVERLVLLNNLGAFLILSIIYCCFRVRTRVH